MTPSPAPSGNGAASRALGLAIGTLRRAPAPLAYALADAVAPALALWGAVHELRAGRRGRGARRNLQIAHRGSLAPTAAWRLLARHSRHLTHLGVDLCRIPRLDAARIERHVDLAALATLRALLAEGRGLVCVSCHLGVWELLGHAASVSGLPVTVVVRRLRPAALDEAITRIRASGGLRCVPQRGGFLALRRALERGEIAGLLADEDEQRSPVFVPFLGTLAATSPAAGILQRVSGAPIAVITCERSARERYRLRLWRVIRPPSTRDREKALREVSAEMNAALGEAILAAPSQWLWGSRRFVTRPPGEIAGSDGLPPRAAASAPDG